MADNKPPAPPWQGMLSRPLLYMAAGLRPPLKPPTPKPPDPPKKGIGGRPKTRSKEPLDEFLRATEGVNSKRRHFGQFLKAVAEINSKNTKIATNQSIAGKLLKQSEYSHLRERTLRRWVAEAIAWQIRLLEKTSPDLWAKVWDIAPPLKITKRALRQKALEHLRRQLLAKRP